MATAIEAFVRLDDAECRLHRVLSDATLRNWNGIEVALCALPPNGVLAATPGHDRGGTHEPPLPPWNAPRRSSSACRRRGRSERAGAA